MTNTEKHPAPAPLSREEAAALQTRVRQAFDALHAPAELCESTLAVIECHRVQSNAEHHAETPKGTFVDAFTEREAAVATPATTTALAPSATTRPSATSADAAPVAQASAAEQPGYEPATRNTHPSKRRRSITVLRRALAAAACVLAVALGALGVHIYSESNAPQPAETLPQTQERPATDPSDASSASTQPQAYIGIDINPSIELSIDAEGTVLAAEALNEDGAIALVDADLAGKPYEQALSDLLTAPSMAAYLVDNPYVEVSVTSADDALAARLQQQSDACLQQVGCQGACNRVSEETREAAHHVGMGAGRYSAAQELLQLDPSLTLEDCAEMTMRELHDRIDACHAESNGQASGGHNQGHHGEGAERKVYS